MNPPIVRQAGEIQGRVLRPPSRPAEKRRRCPLDASPPPISALLQILDSTARKSVPARHASARDTDDLGEPTCAIDRASMCSLRQDLAGRLCNESGRCRGTKLVVHDLQRLSIQRSPQNRQKEVLIPFLIQKANS